MTRIRMNWLLLCLIAFILSGCGDEVPMPPVCEVIPVSQKNSSTRVYLDTSEGMRGFITRDSQYQKALWELRGLLSKETPVYLISNGIEESRIETLGEAIWNPNLYNKDQDNLASAIARFSQEKAMDEQPIFILITDSVQSLSKKSADDGCDEGSDWVCVRQELKSLLDKGWAGCVIGIRSEFDGLVFPEKDGRKNRFPYKSRGAVLNTFRPFYFYIFSPSREGLIAFTSQLRGKLDENLTPNSYQVAELTSLAPTVPVAIKDLAYERDEKLVITEERGNKETGLQPYSRLIIRSEAEPLNSRTVTCRLFAEALREVGEVQWNLTGVYFSSLNPSNNPAERDQEFRYPELKLVVDQGLATEMTAPSQDGKSLLQLRVDWPQDIGTPAWRIYRLDGFVNALSPLDWIRDWSTDDDTVRSQANRTLFFDKLVGDLWKVSPSKNRKVMELYLWVGPTGG